jgi:hypothetical protein
MQVQIDIGFEQLIQIVRGLSATQWSMLKKEVENVQVEKREISDLETFLLTAPTFSDEQIKEIEKTRKAINQWRTKPF